MTTVSCDEDDSARIVGVSFVPDPQIADMSLYRCRFEL